MKQKSIKKRIYELLSDLEDRNSEEISKELKINIDTIQQTLWRDNTSTHPYFHRINKEGNQFYYTISGIFAKDIKDHKIQRLERELEKRKWVEEAYNSIVKRYLKLKEELKKIKKL